MITGNEQALSYKPNAQSSRIDLTCQYLQHKSDLLLHFGGRFTAAYDQRVT